jgi:hypothetical protein
MRTRPIDPTSVRADDGGQVDAAVRVAPGEARCAGGGDDARARRSVPTIWVSAHPGIPGSARTCDERGSNASAVAAARSASTEKEATATRGRSSPTASGDRVQAAAINNRPQHSRLQRCLGPKKAGRSVPRMRLSDPSWSIGTTPPCLTRRSTLWRTVDTRRSGSLGRSEAWTEVADSWKLEAGLALANY